MRQSLHLVCSVLHHQKKDSIKKFSVNIYALEKMKNIRVDS